MPKLKRKEMLEAALMHTIFINQEAKIALDAISKLPGCGQENCTYLDPKCPHMIAYSALEFMMTIEAHLPEEIDLVIADMEEKLDIKMEEDRKEYAKELMASDEDRRATKAHLN